MPDEPAIRAELEAAAARDSVRGAYLFEGPPGTGKRATAVWFAGLLLEQTFPDYGPLEAGQAATTPPAHPDLKWVEPEAGRIRIAAVRQLQTELALVSHQGGRRVALIHQAECLRVEAANALLKLLEEPPPAAVIVLTSTSPEALPVTLRSRTMRYRFTPWPEDRIREALEAEGFAERDALLAGSLAGGSPLHARAWAEAELDEAREMLEWLENSPHLSAGEILDYAEGFRGGEPARQRAQLLLAVLSGLARDRIRRAADSGDGVEAQRWLDRFEAGQRARGEMQRRNLNPQMVVEGLLLELSASQAG